MRKTWRKTIIISLVLIAIEAVAAVIFLHPYYNKQKVFDEIENGRWESTDRYYNKLSVGQQEDVQSCLDDFGAYLCRQYIDGELTYSQTAAAFDAINAIDASGILMNKYMSRVSCNEYKQSVIKLCEASLGYDNSTVYAMNDNIRLVQQRMTNEMREQALIELMNETYQDFLDGKAGVENVNALLSTVSGLSSDVAYAYVDVISNNVACVILYRDVYARAEQYFENASYFEAMDLCRNVDVDPSDTRYRDLFDALYNDASETGKIYYEGLLESYITSGDKKKALELMDSIRKCYGDDFDLTALKEKLAEDWQIAYIDCIENLDRTLEGKLKTFETGQYILEHEYDKLKPDSIVLHDIDDNGVPEMFLYNSSQKDNDYIGCFIYTYTGGHCEFVNFVNVKSFCRDSYLIGFPIAFGRSEGDECSLVQFDGSNLTQIAYCQEIGSTYYVDGTESNDVDYLSARTSILSHADAYNVGNSKGASLDEGETYILAY